MKADRHGERIFLDEGVLVGCSCLKDKEFAIDSHEIAVEKLQNLNERTNIFFPKKFLLPDYS